VEEAPWTVGILETFNSIEGGSELFVGEVSKGVQTNFESTGFSIPAVDEAGMLGKDCKTV